METLQNVTKENIAEVIAKLDKKPRFSDVIVSTNIKTDSISGDEMDDKQFILSVGPHATDLKPGMEVIIDIEKLFRKEMISRDANQERMVLDIFPVPITDEFIGNLISDRVVKLIVE